MSGSKIMNSKELAKIRSCFPQLSGELAYLDNAATTFKPCCVIDEMNEFYCKNNANARRGLYELSVKASLDYEKAREKVASFIGADKHEIIFTRGATESLNLIAMGLNYEGGDIYVGNAEHHSNLLPWRNLARNYSSEIKNIEISDNQYVPPIISDNAKIVAISGYSNVIGELSGIEKIITDAHKYGAIVILDATQMIVHKDIDVHDLDVDFLVFSGHKIYGPMGIGVLYGKYEYLEKLKPVFFGGEMVDEVSEDNYELSEIPYRFEAGTMNIAGAIGLSSALDFLEQNNLEKLHGHELALADHARNAISNIPEFHLLPSKGSIVSFTHDFIHPHDIAQYLGDNGIAVRAGYHCAQPLHIKLSKKPSTRISFSFYNSMEEVDLLLQKLRQISLAFGGFKNV